jgi:ABC-type anion transport system duplicated permease subunit
MVFITFVGALFPVLLNTIHGVEGVDRRLVAAARSLGTGRWQMFTQVILPAAAPSIATGLAIGMGTCWFCLVSAEMISGPVRDRLLHLGVVHLAELWGHRRGHAGDRAAGLGVQRVDPPRWRGWRCRGRREEGAR